MKGIITTKELLVRFPSWPFKEVGDADELTIPFSVKMSHAVAWSNAAKQVLKKETYDEYYERACVIYQQWEDDTAKAECLYYNSIAVLGWEYQPREWLVHRYKEETRIADERYRTEQAVAFTMLHLWDVKEAAKNANQHLKVAP